MGQDKAFLPLRAGTLLSHALEIARAAAGSPSIVGSMEKFADFGPVVEDRYPEQGPLGGIHTALSHSATDLNIILAVDLPFVRLEFIRYLVCAARETHAVIVVPRASGRLQPLCATYRRSFAEVAERSLRDGRNKIDDLFSEVETRVIEAEELRKNGFAEDIFRNLNTPRDWEEATRQTSDGEGLVQM
jgi:molybdopterin-guanine dinucleotide biosynthesis protein A